MNIKEIIKKNQEEIIDYIIKMVDKNHKIKSPSIKLKFRALGKTYDSEKSVENYVNFIKDLSHIHPYETFEPIMKCFIGKTKDDFTEDQKPTVIKIKENFYLTKKLSNRMKDIHLNGISEVLQIPITKI